MRPPMPLIPPTVRRVLHPLLRLSLPIQFRLLLNPHLPPLLPQLDPDRLKQHNDQSNLPRRLFKQTLRP